MNCLQCSLKATHVCGTCKTAHYCSTDCQKRDYTNHKPFCGNLLLTQRNDTKLITEAERITADLLEFLIQRADYIIDNEMIARRVASLLGFRSENTFREVVTSTGASYILDQREFYTDVTSWGTTNSVLSMFDKYVTKNRLYTERVAHYTFLAIPCFNALNNDADFNQCIVFERGLFIHAAPIDREKGTSEILDTITVYNTQLEKWKKEATRLELDIPERAWIEARNVFMSLLKRLTKEQLGYKMWERAQEMINNWPVTSDVPSLNDLDHMSLKVSREGDQSSWQNAQNMCVQISSRYVFEKLASVFNFIFPLPGAFDILRVIEFIAEESLKKYDEHEQSIDDFFAYFVTRWLALGTLKMRFKSVRSYKKYATVFDRHAFFTTSYKDTIDYLTKLQRSPKSLIELEYSQNPIVTNINELLAFAIVNGYENESQKLQRVHNLMQAMSTSLWSASKTFFAGLDEAE